MICAGIDAGSRTIKIVMAIIRITKIMPNVIKIVFNIFLIIYFFDLYAILPKNRLLDDFG